MGARAAVVLFTAGTLTGLSCAPVSAGGVGTVGSPTSGNTCITAFPGQRAAGEQSTGGLLGGDVMQVPAEVRKNSCGSTDVDVDVSF